MVPVTRLYKGTQIVLQFIQGQDKHLMPHIGGFVWGKIVQISELVFVFRMIISINSVLMYICVYLYIYFLTGSVYFVLFIIIMYNY